MSEQLFNFPRIWKPNLNLFNTYFSVGESVLGHMCLVREHVVKSIRKCMGVLMLMESGIGHIQQYVFVYFDISTSV